MTKGRKLRLLYLNELCDKTAEQYQVSYKALVAELVLSYNFILNNKSPR